MGLQLWKPLMVLSIFLLSLRKVRVCADPQVPCLFFFGDSHFDNGNNNNPATSAKADYLPYGIDFQNSGPTGRFTNDMNLADFTAKLLGFPNFQPPFVEATGRDILQGVNYASGFSGIGVETGLNWGLVIPMRDQILNHKIIISRIIGLLGSRNSAEALLKKCIYNFNVGSNDYLDNYFLPQSFQSSHLYTPKQYALVLVHQLGLSLKDLYNVGARKFVVHGVGLIGCTPYARANFNTNGSFCVDEINNISNLFNVEVESLVIQLNADLPDAKFTFINSRALINTNEEPIVAISCCELSSSSELCQSGSTPCTNRQQYVFYDGVHPTNATFYPAALQAYQPATPDAVNPYSISQLALL